MTTTSDHACTRSARLRRWLLLAIATCSVGCSAPGYVARQAWRQLRVLRERESIDHALRRRDLKPEWREKLALAQLARRYAHEVIGLSLSGAYTQLYDTGGKPLAHNLSACPKDSLRPVVWRFPLVGGLPYVGFFDLQQARAAQKGLEAQGLDTELRPVPAFSSLGWFADPVYSPLLDEDVSRLVEVIIHETTHTTIFLRDQVAFNESLAVFVGNQGALNFLARIYGPVSPEVQRFSAAIVRRRRLGELVSELYQRLERLYASSLSRAEKLRRREEEFRKAQARYRQLFPDPSTWGSFITRPLNNAVLLNYGRYNQGLAFHARVYQVLGRDLGRLVALYRLAQKHDDPIAFVARVCRLRGFTPQRM